MDIFDPMALQCGSHQAIRAATVVENDKWPEQFKEPTLIGPLLTKQCIQLGKEDDAMVPNTEGRVVIRIARQLRAEGELFLSAMIFVAGPTPTLVAMHILGTMSGVYFSARYIPIFESWPFALKHGTHC